MVILVSSFVFLCTQTRDPGILIQADKAPFDGWEGQKSADNKQSCLYSSAQAQEVELS